MNNSTVYYSLTQNIDCSAFNNISRRDNFRGTLDGKGYIIGNYTYIGNEINIGLFANGTGAVVKNITFININISSSLTASSYGGVIFGQCQNCNFSDILFNSSSPSQGNRIDLDYSIVGSISGYCYNCQLSNIIILQTIINANRSTIGGLIGQCLGSTITNCFNLGFPSIQLNTILYGNTQVGGLFGILGSSTLIGCGSSGGVVSAFSSCVGGLAGRNQQSIVSQSYTKFSLFVQGNANCGGLFGSVYVISPGNYSINNTYSRAGVSSFSGYKGGLVGSLTVSNNATAYMEILNSYSASVFSGNTAFTGGSVGQVFLGGGNCHFNKVYFDNQKNGNNFYPTISNGNCSDGTLTVSINCTFLYYIVNTTFDTSVWNGDNLFAEYQSTFGSENCPIPSTLTPSTTSPSTLTPSTLIPSTLTPSTTEPSTLPPSTSIPSTFDPSTNNPTSSPSTMQPSTLVPSTTQPSTLPPSTQIPSTLTPSTTQPSTTAPSTLTPSLPPNCLYNVPNCEQCGLGAGLIVDTSIFNVSCIFSGSKWIYSFSDKFSNTTTINQSFTLNSTSLIISGNFNQSSNSTIDIVLSDSNKNGAISVSGCVTLNGNLSLVLENRPQKGITNVVLINYNCSQPINFQNKRKDGNRREVQTVQTSKFVVKPTYKNNKCDKIESTLNNQQGTLSVALSTTIGGKCGGISTGAIIGIVLGVVGGTMLVIIVGAILFWRRNREFDRNISNINIDMDEKKPRQNTWNTNKGHEEKTVWKENPN